MFVYFLLKFTQGYKRHNFKVKFEKRNSKAFTMINVARANKLRPDMTERLTEILKITICCLRDS